MILEAWVSGHLYCSVRNTEFSEDLNLKEQIIQFGKRRSEEVKLSVVRAYDVYIWKYHSDPH